MTDTPREKADVAYRRRSVILALIILLLLITSVGTLLYYGYGETGETEKKTPSPDRQIILPKPPKILIELSPGAPMPSNLPAKTPEPDPETAVTDEDASPQVIEVSVEVPAEDTQEELLVLEATTDEDSGPKFTETPPDDTEEQDEPQDETPPTGNSEEPEPDETILPIYRSEPIMPIYVPQCPY